MVRSLLAIFVCLSGMQAQLRPAEPRERPKLILLIAVDQFRYDYLTRFHGQYTGGFRVLLERGADFVNANLEHYPAVTAAGHATMLSGATLATSGIVGNDWFDRDSGKQVTSEVCDLKPTSRNSGIRVESVGWRPFRNCLMATSLSKWNVSTAST
jgi:predicted AlkP superfamily pyrophosphatase or phosphodiesterase